MLNALTTRRIALGAIILATIGILAVGISAAAVTAEDPTPTEMEMNESATPTVQAADSEESTDECTAGLENIDLHTADDTIRSDDPGRISGAVSTSRTNECPVVVQITFDVPNNMHFQGTGGVESSGQGLMTGSFVIEPGEVRDLSATVYANQLGQHFLVADVEYFPEGNPEMAQQAGGYMLEFSVEESSEDFDPETGETPEPPEDDDPPILTSLLGIVGLSVIGLLGIVWRKTNVTAVFRQT